jgi:hypothetical protein
MMDMLMQSLPKVSYSRIQFFLIFLFLYWTHYTDGPRNSHSNVQDEENHHGDIQRRNGCG